MAVLGLRFCVRASSSCGKWGPLFIAVRGPLTIVTSLVAEHRLQTRKLSSCGSRAQLLRGMWDLPRPGLEPVFPALAGRFSTTAPPGKPLQLFKKVFIYLFGCTGSQLQHVGSVAAHGFLSCGTRTLSCSMHVGSSSLIRDRTRSPWIGSTVSYPLSHQGSPQMQLLKQSISNLDIWNNSSLPRPFQ